MANKKESEKNIRKLTRVGKTSLCVTIPVEMVAKLNWKERQKVVLNLRGSKITIEDWPACAGRKK
jgi:antitoxin component of MazEF toxin-antitoxin module